MRTKPDRHEPGEGSGAIPSVESSDFVEFVIDLAEQRTQAAIEQGQNGPLEPGRDAPGPVDRVARSGDVLPPNESGPAAEPAPVFEWTPEPAAPPPKRSNLARWVRRAVARRRHRRSQRRTGHLRERAKRRHQRIHGTRRTENPDPRE